MSKDKKNYFEFDKFVKDFQKKEDQARQKIESHQKDQPEHPARKYNNLYRERWQNRIKYRR